MTGRQRGGTQPLAIFEAQLGLPGGFDLRQQSTEVNYKAAIHFLEHERPMKQNHWPALALAFIAQAEDLLAAEGLSTVADVYEDFPPEQSDSGRVVNTMNLVGTKGTYRLRPQYNRALTVIRVEMRRDHPSNSAHATQSWDAYRDLVSHIYRASPEERAAIAAWVWKHGVLDAPERHLATVATRVVRPFEAVLSEMDTRNATPGGALLQGLVFGFFRADSPNLTLESHSVNTGGSHAEMIGDVAGFRGGEVELAVEVKDIDLGEADVEAVLVDFLEDLVHAPNATAVFVANEVSEDARASLLGYNVIALSRDDLRARVITWDLPKQQEAIRGADYFLSRIQKSTKLQSRLTEYLVQDGLDGGLSGEGASLLLEDVTKEVEIAPLTSRNSA